MINKCRVLCEFSVYDDGGSYIAYVLSRMGRTDDAMKKRADNIYKALDYLKFELTSLAGNYKNQGKLEEAYVCYRLYPDIYDIMVGDRDDEMPFYGFYSYDNCAEVCVGMIYVMSIAHNNHANLFILQN